MGIVKHIVGDITKTNCDIIAHGVNCQNVMGAGVARALYEKWPEVKKDYHQFYANMHDFLNFLPEDYLGHVKLAKVEDSRFVANCFTQLRYGKNPNERYVSYHALRECMMHLNKMLTAVRWTVAIPKIGCGLAGGDWKIVERIINKELECVDVFLYTLE